MRKSKVFFTNMWASHEENLPAKLKRLAVTAGFDAIDFVGKFVAIKIHFGERGNLAYLRPNYARTVADMVRERGGKPFLTDANTLYVGGRKNALDHLDTAYMNGFSPLSTGCHVVIADGLKGTDEALVPVPGGKLIERARIGQAVMDADIVVSLTHFKAHEATGIGGALKNIGMGCGSKGGKMEMHSAGKPKVDATLCIGCGKCVKNCGVDAIAIVERKAVIDERQCVACGRCVGVCPTNAVEPAWDAANDDLNRKIAEYAAAVLNGRPHFHISMAIDISPFCDCHAENDVPIVEDVGMFASFDPVALDVACGEAVNAMPPKKGSLLGRCDSRGADHFSTIAPGTNWWVCVQHAMDLGLGSSDYELVTI